MYLPTIPNLAAAARTWSVESQQVSRRNAMLAATQCAQRRAEREDIADYLEARVAPKPPPADSTVRAAQR
jgi:hypothetical protein